MTDDDIEQIEARLRTATPGPWMWTEQEVNARDDRTDKRHTLRQYVYLLQGSPFVDEYDHVVMALRWDEVKAQTLVNVSPGSDDAAFIAHAHQDITALLAEVRRLRCFKERDALIAEIGRLGTIIAGLVANAWEE